MSNGPVHKYEAIINFYKDSKNIEESRNYIFDFYKYAPNNYTLYLIQNYTLVELREVARLCKDNAIMYGQVYWSVTNAQNIKLSANKEATVFALHTYLYYKYVAFHIRLSRPRNPYIYNSRLVQKIQKRINKWVAIQAKTDIEKARIWYRMQKGIAKAAASASPTFRTRASTYKRMIQIELTNLEYDQEEHYYQLGQIGELIQKVNGLIHVQEDKLTEYKNELISCQDSIKSLAVKIKEYYESVGESIKVFINQYPFGDNTFPINYEDNLITLADTSANHIIPPHTDTMEPELKVYLTSENRDIDFIMNRIPFEMIKQYYTSIGQYTLEKRARSDICKYINDCSKAIDELHKKLADATNSRIKRENMLQLISNSLNITKKALIRRRKFDIEISCNESDISTQSCPICLEESNRWAKTNCGHIFCRGCICKSLDSIYTQPIKPYCCAMCRSEVKALETVDLKTKYLLEIRYVHSACYV